MASGGLSVVRDALVTANAYDINDDDVLEISQI